MGKEVSHSVFFPPPPLPPPDFASAAAVWIAPPPTASQFRGDRSGIRTKYFPYNISICFSFLYFYFVFNVLRGKKMQNILYWRILYLEETWGKGRRRTKEEKKQEVSFLFLLFLRRDLLVSGGIEARTKEEEGRRFYDSALCKKVSRKRGKSPFSCSVFGKGILYSAAQYRTDRPSKKIKEGNFLL